MAEMCVAILDDRLFFLCYCNIYEMEPDIFEIFRTFSKYLEKKIGNFRKRDKAIFRDLGRI